jgi:hypothetical protein
VPRLGFEMECEAGHRRLLPPSVVAQQLSTDTDSIDTARLSAPRAVGLAMGSVRTDICLPACWVALAVSSPPCPLFTPLQLLASPALCAVVPFVHAVCEINWSICVSVCVCVCVSLPQTCASSECECWASLRRCYVVTPPAAALNRQSVEADMTPAAANGCNPATAWKLALQIENPVQQSAASASMELGESNGRATSAELLLPANSFLVVALPSTYIYTYASYGMAAAASCRPLAGMNANHLGSYTCNMSRWQRRCVDDVARAHGRHARRHDASSR